MPFVEAFLRVDLKVKEYCTLPYPDHPRGCPNYGMRACCPPEAPVIHDVMDMDRPVFLVWSAFDLAAHVEKMMSKHPSWSYRQAACCLYWQGTARNALMETVNEVERGLYLQGQRPKSLMIPEALGIDVCLMMKEFAGIELEWPPRNLVYKVAVIQGVCTSDD